MNGDQNPDTPPAGWQFHPGDTVSPQAEAAAANHTPERTAQTQTSAATQPATEPAPVEQALETLAESPAPEVEAPDPAADTVTWTASEFVAHQKTIGWYAVLVLVAVVLAGLTYLVTKDKVSASSILLIAFVFGLYGARKPRVLGYKLDRSGLMIAQKFYAYGLFRSFAVMNEGPFSSIALVPLRRFMPLLTIYYSPEDEDKIVEILAERLPIEQRKRDLIDNLMHKIRF